MRALGVLLVVLAVQILSAGGVAADRTMTAVIGLPVLAAGAGLLFGAWAERRAA